MIGVLGVVGNFFRIKPSGVVVNYRLRCRRHH